MPNRLSMEKFLSNWSHYIPSNKPLMNTTSKLLLAWSLLALVLSAQAKEPVVVKTLTLEQALIVPEISAPATVMSLGDSRISAELNARIVDIPVRVGDIIEADTVLVRLDCGDYQLKVRELQTRLDGVKPRIRFAHQQLSRVRKLKKQRTVSQELLDQRESNLASLLAERDGHRASLAMAQRNLDRCTITAPFKAVVLERLADLGEYVVPGTPLVRVLDIAHLEVSAKIINKDVPSLQKAKNFILRYDDQDYALQLRALTPVIDPLTRTREARFLFLEASAPAGASGRLVWTLGTALPADLLVRRAQNIGVLLVQEQRALFHLIPNAQEGRPAWVQLPPDTLLIGEGRFGLQDGDAIRVID